MMGFFTGPKIAFGPGAVEQIVAFAPRQTVLLVAPAVARLDPIRRLVDWLAEFSTRPTVVEGSGAAPTLSEIDRLASAIAGRPDLIIGVGGGSLIDAAKALRARWLRPDLELSGWTPLTDVPANAPVHLVAIPTTGGSGSEMTGTAHLFDGEGNPRELSHRELAADWAFLDPEYSRSVPAAEATATGFEVIAHALEALASEWANPFTDAFARDALAVGLPALVRLGRQPRDAEARSVLHYAAGRAGLAAANSSLGLAHAWARALQSELPRAGYARLLAVALPTVIEYNFPSRRDVYEGVAPLLPTSTSSITESFSGRIASLVRQLGLPSDLSAVGIEVESLRSSRDRIVRRALQSTSSVSNPRVPSPSEAGRLLDSMAYGVGRRPP